MTRSHAPVRSNVVAAVIWDRGVGELMFRLKKAHQGTHRVPKLRRNCTATSVYTPLLLGELPSSFVGSGCDDEADSNAAALTTSPR